MLAKGLDELLEELLEELADDPKSGIVQLSGHQLLVQGSGHAAKQSGISAQD